MEKCPGVKMVSELEETVDRLTEEFGLLAKKTGDGVQLFRINTEDVTNPDLRTPDRVEVYSVLGVSSFKEKGREFVMVAGENTYGYKEEMMGLPNFTRRLDSFLRGLGFKEEHFQVASMSDLALAMSTKGWKKEIEVKVMPKVRIG